MKPFFAIYFFLIVLVLAVLGFRGSLSEKPPIEIFPDMDRQMKFSEQGKTSFFEDGRMDRPRVAGTIPTVTEEQEAFPHLIPDFRFREDDYIISGKLEDGSFGNLLPIEINNDTMDEGEKLFNIFCAVCHGESGNGKGVVAQERYGYPTIVSLLQDRISDQPHGEIYNTIVNGKNTMMPYGHKLRIDERWKVVLYVRALQRASKAKIEDVPQEHRGDLGL